MLNCGVAYVISRHTIIPIVLFGYKTHSLILPPEKERVNTNTEIVVTVHG
jgi:hypothetical protein